MSSTAYLVFSFDSSDYSSQDLIGAFSLYERAMLCGEQFAAEIAAEELTHDDDPELEWLEPTDPVGGNRFGKIGTVMMTMEVGSIEIMIVKIQVK